MIHATDSIQGVEHKEKFDLSQQSWFSVGTWAQIPVVQALRARVDEQAERRRAERGAGEEVAVVVVEQDRRKRPRREARGEYAPLQTDGNHPGKREDADTSPSRPLASTTVSESMTQFGIPIPILPLITSGLITTTSSPPTSHNPAGPDRPPTHLLVQPQPLNPPQTVQIPPANPRNSAHANPTARS